MKVNTAENQTQAFEEESALVAQKGRRRQIWITLKRSAISHQPT